MSHKPDIPSFGARARGFFTGEWLANATKARSLRRATQTTAKEAYQSLHRGLATAYQKAGQRLDAWPGNPQVVKITSVLPGDLREDKDNWDVVTYDPHARHIAVVQSRGDCEATTLSQLQVGRRGGFSVRITESTHGFPPQRQSYSLGDIRHDTSIEPIQRAITSIANDTAGRLATLTPGNLDVRESRTLGLQTTPYGLRARGVSEAPRT